MIDADIGILVERYFDGTLTVSEEEKLKNLLVACPELGCRIDDETMLHELFRKIPPRTFCPQFNGILVEQVKQEAKLQHVLASVQRKQFRTLFHVRVMDRLARDFASGGHALGEALDDGLAGLFPRVALPVMIVAVIATLMNATSAPAGVPLIEAVLGLHATDSVRPGFLILG